MACRSDDTLLLWVIVRRSLCLLGSVLFCWGMSGCSTRKGEGVDPSKLTPSEWVSLGKPGRSHLLLGVFVGTWDVVITSRSAPQAPPDISTGTSISSWALGGRFVREDFKGSGASESYQGVGFLGFDSGARLFTSVWMDSLNTSMAVSRGRYNLDTHTFHFIGAVYDPLAGREREIKTQIKIVSPDQYEVSMLNSSPKGETFTSFQMVYRRKNGAIHEKK